MVVCVHQSEVTPGRIFGGGCISVKRGASEREMRDSGRGKGAF